MCTTQVLAMEVEANFRYWAGVSFQIVVGCVKVEKAREVMDVGWTLGRNVCLRNLTLPLGLDVKRSTVKIVMEVSAPADCDSVLVYF